MVGCSGNDQDDRPKPDGFIEREEMVDLLKKIQVVEARYQRRMFEPRSELKQKTLEQYTKLFKTEGVTLEQFKASFDYYKEDPELLSDMYNQVIEELTKEQAAVQKELKEETEAKRSEKVKATSSDQEK
jgi:hypothetical protein